MPPISPTIPVWSALRVFPLSPRFAVSLILLGWPITTLAQVATPASPITPTTESTTTAKPATLTPEQVKLQEEAAANKTAKADGEIVVLSPFEVTASSDEGYQARDTLSGSRLNSSLRDVSSQVQVMTPEFIKDLGIVDLNDAIGYSMNVETSAQTYDVSNTNNAGNDGSLQVFSGAPRTRGIDNTIIGRDFFITAVPIDAYNTERFTFAPGANNMLFGNSTPAGSIDATTKRARANRPTYLFEHRFDSEQSERAVADVNIPLIRNHLAVRWVGLKDRTNDYRDSAYRDQDRNFFTATFTPFKNLSVRGFYEKYDEHAQPVRNTIVKDRVTPWLDLGSPVYNNGTAALGGVFPPPAVSATTPYLRIPVARTNPYYFMDSSGGLGNTTYQVFNTVQTVGQQSLRPSPDNFDNSLLDESIVPLDTAIAGNAVQNRQNAESFGAVLNFNPVKNLYLEVANSHEMFEHRYVDYFRNSELTIYADANRYLNDRTTPNPSLGRYYIEDIFAAAGYTFNVYDQTRMSAVYQLDFTKHENWTKWLGRYNLSFFYDHLQQDNAGAGQRADPRRILPGAVAPIPSNVNTNLFFRYYLPDATHPGVARVDLPFDPMQEGNIQLPNSGGTVLRGWHSEYGADTAPTFNRVNSHSRAFATQGFLWKNKVVLNYSYRRDAVERLTPASGTIRNALGGFEFLDNAYGTLEEGEFTTTSYGIKSRSNWGVVYHATDWMTLRYAKLGTAQVTGLTRVNLDGSDIDLGSGAGEEYGVSFRLLQNQLTVSLNKYTTRSVGAVGSSLGGGGASNNVPVAINGGGGNQITNDLAALEQAALRAGAPISTRFAHWHNLLLADTDFTTDPSSDTATARSRFDFITDRESEGYELQVTGNPTPAWRLSVSATENTNRETNLAPQFFELINERLSVWSQYLNAPTWRISGANQQTLGQLLQASIGNFLFIQRSEGQPAVADRKYRFTGTANYTFQKGWLRGFSVGGVYIWRSPAAVAYNPVTITDNPFVVPGLTNSTITINDPNSPIRAGGISTFDARAGYRKRFWKNKLEWTVQLNVRNILDDRELVVQRATSAGVASAFTTVAPRTFILTNTISF